MSSATRAADYTDVWLSNGEAGWGVNIVQSDAFLFLTFFIYGPDNKPTWYTAQLTYDSSSGKYTGGLYLTRGTYYAVPWNLSDYGVTQVGTASFQPSALNAYQGTLSYSVNGVGTVTKQIERLTLTTIALGGSYVGGQSGAYSGCSNSAQNGAYTDVYSLSVAQTASNVATFNFAYGGGLNCTMSGTLEQHGQLYRIANASYQCSGAFTLNTTATIYELKQTAQGIEGRFVADVGGGCQENAQFSAVLQ